MMDYRNLRECIIDFEQSGRLKRIGEIAIDPWRLP